VIANKKAINRRTRQSSGSWLQTPARDRYADDPFWQEFGEQDIKLLATVFLSRAATK
jgi:hypothetical protein